MGIVHLRLRRSDRDDELRKVYPGCMRLFLALLLEPPLLAALRDTQGLLRRLDLHGRVRWVDPAGIHLTLKFLGEVDGASRLLAALDPAVEGLQPPLLGLGALGAFPNRKRPRVLWVGIREEGRHLARVQARVEEACLPLGWDREGRKFQPHLTVGRVREAGSASHGLGQDLLQALDEDLAGTVQACHHRRVALVRSHLSPKGARYESLHVWHLSDAGSGPP